MTSRLLPFRPRKARHGKRLTGKQAGGTSTLSLNDLKSMNFVLLFFPSYSSVNIRPIEWSQSSVLFTAHPTQPLVSGRHFSSSKQFRLPSPPPIVSSPKSYEPPSIISVAPDDEWLFAYFPSRDGDGTGCLWIRGAQIDSWAVKEWWSFAPGAGVVAASWLGQARVVRNFRLFSSAFCNRIFFSVDNGSFRRHYTLTTPWPTHADIKPHTTSSNPGSVRECVLLSETWYNLQNYHLFASTTWNYIRTSVTTWGG